MNDMTVPISVDRQIKALSQLAGQIRSAILPARASLPATTLEELSQLESRLFRLAQDVAAFAEERNNLIALTEISQVINSSLDLDEDLAIVMDDMIRLADGDAGALMQGDDIGQID